MFQFWSTAFLLDNKIERNIYNSTEEDLHVNRHMRLNEHKINSRCLLVQNILQWNIVVNILRGAIAIKNILLQYKRKNLIMVSKIEVLLKWRLCYFVKLIIWQWESIFSVPKRSKMVLVVNKIAHFWLFNVFVTTKAIFFWPQ